MSHLMMSLFEIFHDWPVRVEREARGGGGLARTAAPGHGDLFAVTLVASRQPDGLQTRRFPVMDQVGRGSVCRNQAARTDGAMRWAAYLGGSPMEGMCEGNPGRLFSGQGYVPVSVACSAWLLPRTRRRRHEALRLESQTAVDRWERRPGRRNAGNDGRTTGWRRFSRPSQNGLDVNGDW